MSCNNGSVDSGFGHLVLGIPEQILVIVGLTVVMLIFMLTVIGDDSLTIHTKNSTEGRSY